MIAGGRVSPSRSRARHRRNLRMLRDSERPPQPVAEADYERC